MPFDWKTQCPFMLCSKLWICDEFFYQGVYIADVLVCIWAKQDHSLLGAFFVPEEDPCNAQGTL